MANNSDWLTASACTRPRFPVTSPGHVGAVSSVAGLFLAAPTGAGLSRLNILLRVCFKTDLLFNSIIPLTIIWRRCHDAVNGGFRQQLKHLHGVTMIQSNIRRG